MTQYGNKHHEHQVIQISAKHMTDGVLEQLKFAFVAVVTHLMSWEWMLIKFLDALKVIFK